MTSHLNTLKASLVEAIVLDLICPIRAVYSERGELSGHARNWDNSQPGNVSGHHFMSAFEHAYGALLPLDVFKPIDGNGNALAPGTFSCSYLLSVAVADVYKHALRSAALAKLDEAILFDAFVGFSVGHACSLPDTRNWFSLVSDRQRVLNMLAEHQYLGRLGDRYRWADKASPAMRNRCLWGEDGNSYSDTEDRLLEKIWQTMPAAIRSRYFLDGFDPLGFAICFSQCWDSELEAWISLEPISEPGEATLSGGGLGIAKQLEARFLKPYRAT